MNVKQNALIILAVIIALIGLPFCLVAKFLAGLSDAGESTNIGAAVLSIFPGIALLILFSIFLSTDFEKISTKQVIAIMLAAILSFAELFFILSLAGIINTKIFQ